MNIPMGRIVLLDAGSSGTRLYAYQWRKYDSNPDAPKAPKDPKVELVYEGVKAKGAIEKQTDEELMKKYLDQIFKPAVDMTIKKNLLAAFGFETVDALQPAEVPIFVLGTAGMRAYKKAHPSEHDELSSRIESYIADREEYASPKYQTITGEHEAAYGWVAANFLLGKFSTEYETKVQDTFGYLEMGGQSAQIAFQPFENELTPDKLHDGDITTVNLGAREFDLVLKTWDLGSNQAWREYQSDIAATGESQVNISKICVDPDSPHGRKWTYSEVSELGETKDFALEGNGAFDSQRFHGKVLKILDRLSQPATARGSRLLDENLVAALQGRHFVGGANFWYSTRGVFGRNVDKDGTAKTTVFSFKEYLAEVKSTTELAWPYLQLRLRHGSQEVMGSAWFVAEWIKCVLVDGFGFNFAHQPSAQREDDLSFRPYGGTANAELTWTLGRAVLYANKLDDQDDELVVRPGLDIIATRHQQKLNDAMIVKAVRLEESIWGYITLAASFRSQKDVRGNADRAIRMISLAETAAKTSRDLRHAAWKGMVAAFKQQLGADEEDPELEELNKVLAEFNQTLVTLRELERAAPEELDQAVNDLVSAGDMDREISKTQCDALVDVIQKAAGSLFFPADPFTINA